jgi:hypothetical protein
MRSRDVAQEYFIRHQSKNYKNTPPTKNDTHASKASQKFLARLSLIWNRKEGEATSAFCHIFLNI